MSYKTIIITRPLEQSVSLITAIQARSDHAIPLPMIAIDFAIDEILLQKQFNKSPFYDFVIVTSANAIPMMRKFWQSSYSNKAIIIAIGDATAKKLFESNINVAITPSLQTSEGILELPQLQKIQNKKILICCGKNPRPLLKESLQQRQATITEAICYRRTHPQYSNDQLELIFKSANSFVFTSGEGLENFLSQLSAILLQQLQTKQLIVISERIAKMAQAWGLNPVIAAGMNDEAILAALHSNGAVKKPTGGKHCPIISGKTAAEYVIEDRR